MQFTRQYIIEKWRHAGLQKYLRNMSWMFVSRFFCMGVSFLTMMFIARKLGPTNFGQLNYALSFIGIFSVFTSLGVDNVLYRNLIVNPERRREFLGSAFFIRIFAGSLIFTLITVITLFWNTNDVSKILIIILAGTFIFTSFQVIIYEFQSRVESKHPSIVAMVVSLVLNVLKIIVIMSGKGVIYLALILLFESVLSASLYILIYKKVWGGRLSSWKLDLGITKSLLIDSWPFIFSGTFIFIYTRIDQILIKHLLDSRSVGLYSSAVAITEVWNFLPNTIIPALFPAIVNGFKTSPEEYRSRVKGLLKIILFVSIVTSLLTALFSNLLVQIIYGSFFIEASSILKIYVWSNIGNFVMIMASSYLLVENRKKTLAFVTLVPMVINVLLNSVWIPRYGLSGAAYASLVSYCLGPISLLLFKDTRSIFLKKKSE